jgi:hypothetical protein
MRAAMIYNASECRKSPQVGVKSMMTGAGAINPKHERLTSTADLARSEYEAIKYLQNEGLGHQMVMMSLSFTATTSSTFLL